MILKLENINKIIKSIKIIFDIRFLFVFSFFLLFSLYLFPFFLGNEPDYCNPAHRKKGN